MEIALIILIAALVLVVGGLAAIAAAKRHKALVEWAAARGLSFDKSKNRSFDAIYPGFDKLKQGSNRYAYNIMRGEWEGRGLVAFDYHYETYSRDNKGRRRTHHHTFSAVVLEAGVPLKPLVIRPEGFFDKVAGFFGYDDIDFESAEFSRSFHVKAPDRKWAYDVLHARAIEFLMAQPRMTIEFYRGEAIALGGGCYGVEEFEAAIGTLAGLFDRFPDYLVRQLRERASGW